MKKTLCLILALLMLTSSFASCSNNNSDKTEDTTESTETVPVLAESTETETEETTPAITDDLPDIKFEGHDYKIYNTNPETNTWYTTVHVTFEEDTGEPITSAIFYRNLAVEERFDVKITEIEHTSAEAKAVITAGTADDMDLILTDGGEAIGFIQNNNVYDLNTVDYIDLDKPYWDQNARKYLSIAGHYYGGGQTPRSFMRPSGSSRIAPEYGSEMSSSVAPRPVPAGFGIVVFIWSRALVSGIPSLPLKASRARRSSRCLRPV